MKPELSTGLAELTRQTRWIVGPPGCRLFGAIRFVANGFVARNVGTGHVVAGLVEGIDRIVRRREVSKSVGR